MKEKRDILTVIEKEAPNLNALLDLNQVKEFNLLVGELRDTWTKKQIFRTRTEMEISVLSDAKYPTNASKYWQCVREQNVFLENLMNLSFDYRKNDVELEQKELELEKEEDLLKQKLIKIEIDQKIYSKANMQLVAKDRMREISEWSTFKKLYNDGTFDTKNVDTHQLESFGKIFKNKKNTLTPGSSQPEVFNVIGQLQTTERVVEERKALGHQEKKAIEETPVYGKRS
tara:strand:- start:159 stop:845 length:687 start_codon:yes stop_codon:yes gene_type:complete